MKETWSPDAYIPQFLKRGWMLCVLGLAGVLTAVVIFSGLEIRTDEIEYGVAEALVRHPTDFETSDLPILSVAAPAQNLALWRTLSSSQMMTPTVGAGVVVTLPTTHGAGSVVTVTVTAGGVPSATGVSGASTSGSGSTGAQGMPIEIKAAIIGAVSGMLAAVLGAGFTHFLIVRYERKKEIEKKEEEARKRDEEKRRALHAQLTRGASELAERWEYAELADAIQIEFGGPGGSAELLPLWLRLAVVGCVFVLAIVLGIWHLIAFIVYYFSAFLMWKLMSSKLDLGQRLGRIGRTTEVSEAQGPVVDLFHGIEAVLDKLVDAVRFVVILVTLGIFLVFMLLWAYGKSILAFAGALVVCIGLGLLLDFVLGISPCIMIIGAVIGLAAGLALVDEFSRE